MVILLHTHHHSAYAASLRLVVYLAFVLVVFSMTVEITAQSEPGLDRDRSPFVAATYSLSKEIWEETDIAYFTEDVDVDNAIVNVAEALISIINESGGDETLQVVNGQACEGVSSTNPAYRFEWNREHISETLPMRIFAVGEQLTLVIREPDGDWLCSTEAILDIAELRSGTYHVWVGSKQPPNSNSFSARLYVTFGNEHNNYSPQNAPPPCCIGLNFSNPANEDSDPVLTYLERQIVSPTSGGEILQVSIDAILRGTSGERFLLEVTPLDPVTGAVIPVPNPNNSDERCAGRATYCDSALLRNEQLRLDYSGTFPRAVEFNQIDLAALGFTRDSYRFVFTIASLESSGNLAEPDVIYEFSSAF